jgi:putative ABC transport system substrate-binding protein
MQFGRLKRREFIALIGGAAAWPVPAGAQQHANIRRIGMYMSVSADDAELVLLAFRQELERLGWSAGR